VKPRILQLIDSFDEGGSERQAIDLTRRLYESGKFEIHLATLKAEGVLRTQVEQLDLGPVPSFPLRSFYGPAGIAQLAKFVQYLKKSKIDLLHTHDFYTNVFGMTAGFLAGVKVRIASRRETTGMRTPGQLRLQKTAFALAHQVVANSESVRRKLLEEGVGDDRISVIYNGLDTMRVRAAETTSRAEKLQILGLPLASSDQRFVTILANMRHDVKDYPMFLRAAQAVVQAEPKAAFLLAGEGELQQSLRELSSQLKISDRTFFLSRCEHIAELLSVSEVCVLSSKAEGFSNSILEYMAAGRPVVATNVGGASEAIVENETGYLVPSGQDQLMADRIISLLRDSGKACAMGEHGRRVVAHKFSSAALLANTEALYQRLFKQKRLPRNLVAPSFDSNGVEANGSNF
jgi:glycosyltransferase involved in cell wall biosynthesis